MRTVLVVTVFLVGVLACTLTGADEVARKPAGDLPEVKELPNPFQFSDGSPVRTREDWARRRVELKELFQSYMYGHLPPRPEKMTTKRGKTETDKENELTIQDLELNLEHKGESLTLPVRVVLPSNAKGKVPVLIQGAFGFRPKGAAPSNKRYTTFTSRGYAVAEISFQQVAADNKDKARGSGIYKLYGDKIDCGALMAWAWGMHRVIDALPAIPEIDTTKVIVTGHSRYGKAALIAGAFDERIALTVPSHSGCAGAAPYRFIYGKSEQLHNIVGAFPHWFRSDFNQFVGKVNHLPVDQHQLIALVAPRALLGTEGLRDTWINPEGAQLTYQAARKVYEFLKAGDKISIRYRDVGHIPSNEDLLDYADHVFAGKKLSREFGELPYKEETRGFTWDVPK
jgi:endo-1,4-beta-xylanase